MIYIYIHLYNCMLLEQILTRRQARLKLKLQLKQILPNVLLLAGLHLFSRIHLKFCFPRRNESRFRYQREVFYKRALLPLMSETLKNTYEEVHF